MSPDTFDSWRRTRDQRFILGIIFSILGLIYAIAATICVVYMKSEKQPSGKREELLSNCVSM